MLKTILFDNDGVLVDTEGVFYEANRGMLKEYGIELGEKEFAEMSLTRGMSLADMIVSFGYSPEEADRARCRRDIIYDRMLRERGAGIVIPHVAEVLENLHQKVTIGIVTCCRAMHFKTLHDASGFRKYFDFVVGEEDFIHHKPHPEPYLTALKRGNLLPENVLAVEDSERGILSARAAGIRTAAIPRGISMNGDFSKADLKFKSILDFYNDIKKELS